MFCTTKETKEFFMFMYFGILPEGIFNEKEKLKKEYNDYFDYVARKCAYRAYRDVCRTIKYAISSTDLNKNLKEGEKHQKYWDFKKTKDSFINNEIDIILSGISTLLSTDNFDNKHSEICKSMRIEGNTEQNIKNLFKNNCEFTYGMAQKWLNMTIKNLILADDMLEGCTGYNELWKKRVHFHVPVDKNILKAAKSDFNITGYSESWSNWEKKDYIDFTNELNTKIEDEDKYYCSLGWEHSAWMKYAE